jgi:hypothetical protein
MRSVARWISIRNGIEHGFSPVFMRLVADARIAALFLDAPEINVAGFEPCRRIPAFET